MKKTLSTFLALVMVFSLLTVPVSAVGQAPSAQSNNVAEHYFYDQLTTQAKAIYNALWDMYDKGMMKDGQTSYDLTEDNIVSQSAIKDYLNGDRTLFNDFAAAKDAFDLEHPEVWYMDSSYLSLRVTQSANNGPYHAYMGPGRSDKYYVAGVQDAADVNIKTRELNAEIDSIKSGAEEIAKSGLNDLSADSTIIKQVQYVHKRITESISYRYESDCKAENVGYVRTVYGLVTHEGVCEAYARSMQLILNELGIPCVPIHGLQTSGTPEEHMWNAVLIGKEWYVVDATWDDPLVLDASGNVKAGKDGFDGNETENYLLVGQDVVKGNWQPSGYVSTGAMEFEYPKIALTSLSTSIPVVEGSGLTVVAIDSMMDDIKSTEYRISYNGDGLVEAANKGYYFLNKMSKVNADGSVSEFQGWYYIVHGLHGISYSFDPDDNFQNTGNPYFFDSSSYLTQNLSNVDYVEFAITTKAPPNWQSAEDLLDPDMDGYYSGDGSDIIVQTGQIFNPNGGYDPPPYVKNVSPLFNTPVYVGQTYNIHIGFTDELYHPDQASIDSAKKLDKVNDAEKAMAESITLYYEGTTYSWGVNARQPHTFANKPVPTNVRWTCTTHPDGHTGTANTDGSITMSGIGADCRLTALDFNFAASRMWADDSVQYEFHLTGLVGVTSNKFVKDGGWSYVFENQSAYCAYRCSQGIDWNLWGQPQLLDSDLDLSKMVVEGVDGKQESLEALRQQMHLDDYDMNGRLMLVVEQFDDSSDRAAQLKDAIHKDPDIGVSAGAIKNSSLYEIDFARICGKTIVKTGDSLRMSVGFPAGITNTDGLVFKVYHFIRDKAGYITDIEEIPVTVTPYGLVFLCDSFSPFAIVALDADQVKEEPSTDKTVMIVSGEGGDILLADGTTATGRNGVVTLKKGQHVTLQIRPSTGYAVSSATFDGHPISASDKGTVVIAYEDIQSSVCLLNASFVSATVRQADNDKGMTSAVADNSQAGSSKVSERLQTTPGTAPESSTEVTGNPKLENPFVDVAANDYYYNAVLWAYENGVTTGTGDGTTFSPTGNCTRAQFVTFLYRAAGEPDLSSSVANKFNDVSETTHKSYYNAILWAAEQGITTGSGDGTTFDPGKAVTRAQAVTFMYRYAQKAGIATKTGTEGFDDVTNTGPIAPYYDAIRWAVANGITNGNSTTKNTFGPMDTCQRGMMVTFLYRLFTDAAA